MPPRRRRNPDTVFIAAAMLVVATAAAVIGTAVVRQPPAPPQPSPSQPRARHQQDGVAVEILAEHRCLAEALYFEARGEGRPGQQAIAEVIFHRMASGRFGHSICAVVYEGAGIPGCQFTFTCDGALLRPKEAAAWHQAQAMAGEIFTREAPVRNTTASATHFHSTSVSPLWAVTMTRTAQIGNHIFYKGSDDGLRR